MATEGTSATPSPLSDHRLDLYGSLLHCAGGLIAREPADGPARALCLLKCSNGSGEVGQLVARRAYLAIDVITYRDGAHRIVVVAHLREIERIANPASVRIGRVKSVSKVPGPYQPSAPFLSDLRVRTRI